MAVSRKKGKTKRTVRNVNWFIDTHYKLKQKRDKLKEQAKEVQKDIDKLEGEALHKFSKEGIEGSKGRLATGFIQELDHYNVADRRKLDAYVKRSGRTHPQRPTSASPGAFSRAPSLMTTRLMLLLAGCS